MIRKSDAAHSWGGWRLKDRRVLEFAGEPARGYVVELDRCDTCAEVLDWVAQVNGKAWASPEIVGDLFKALDDLLELQANYCSGGADKGRQAPLDLVAKRIVEWDGEPLDAGDLG